MATDESFKRLEDGDLEALQRELADNREEFIELLEDVRARVIQVKRETDEKAPADHDHVTLQKKTDTLEGELEELRTDLSELEQTVTGGFDNFESILESLLEEDDAVHERLKTVAGTVVDLRERERQLTAQARRQAEANQLKLAANRAGVRNATCDGCGSNVDISLLTAAACPQCEGQFADVESRFLRSDRLLTGEPPALDGDVAPAPSESDHEEPT